MCIERILSPVLIERYTSRLAILDSVNDLNPIFTRIRTLRSDGLPVVIGPRRRAMVLAKWR